MITILEPNARSLEGLTDVVGDRAKLYQASVLSSDGKTRYNVAVIEAGDDTRTYCSCPDRWVHFARAKYACKHVIELLETLKKARA